MTSQIKTRLFCAALLLSSLQFGISGTLTNTFFFGPPLNPVWEIYGSYQITNHMQSATIKPMDIVFNGLGLYVDAKGKVQGLGNSAAIVGVGNDLVGGDCKVSGKISGGGAKTRLNFTIKFKGNGNVAGVETICNISAKYDLAVNAVDRTLVGKNTGSANFSKLGNGKLNTAITLPLPPGTDGKWSVRLDLVPFGNKLSGTALVLVDSWTNMPSTVLNTKAKGNLPKQSSSAKLKLSGYGDSAGTQLDMQFALINGATNLAATVKGKVLGQKVKN